MRRIEVKHCRCGIRDGRTVTCMSTTDYRLMRAVVKAANYWSKVDPDIYDRERHARRCILTAIRAFNAKPRKQP